MIAFARVRRGPLSFQLASALLFGALATAACTGTAPSGPAGATRVALPAVEHVDGPIGEIERLEGIDTEGLAERELRSWWTLVSRLYAPCPDQAVSIAQCVKEARPCKACTTAARLVASRVRAGAPDSEVEAAYAVRFAAKPHAVDLAGSPSRGPADAPVTVVVWSDFECPYCRITMPVLDGAFERHAGRVRLVHKFYPLSAHPNAEVAARAAFAAQVQGKYWEMERLVFENQGRLSEDLLRDFARSLGLDMKRFEADWTSDAAKEALRRDREQADRAGLQGRPFILINGRVFDLARFRVQDDLAAWIAEEVDLAAPAGAAASAATSAESKAAPHPVGSAAPVREAADGGAAESAEKPR